MDESLFVLILLALFTFGVYRWRRHRSTSHLVKWIQGPSGESIIELRNTQDLAFARNAQGAQVNNTILPSGYRTPPRNLYVYGTYLVESLPN